MNEEIRKRYQYSAWGDKEGKGSSILLKNFVPWEEDAEGWKRRNRQVIMEGKERQLIRTVWADPKDSNASVLIGVVETPSFRQAQEYLIELLANNQLARLLEGPEELGNISFVHPKGVTPGSFWVRGNLCLSVTSFGKKPVEVLSWAHRLDRRIMEKPKTDRDVMTLKARKEQVSASEEVPLSYSLPWKLGEDGGYKFFSTGGELFIKGDEVYFRAKEKGEVQIEAFAVESGREPYRGLLTLKVG